MEHFSLRMRCDQKPPSAIEAFYVLMPSESLLQFFMLTELLYKTTVVLCSV